MTHQAIDQLVQVAGVADEAEARMLVECGVSFLGFPLRLPVHTEDLSEAEAVRVIATIEPPAEAVLITYLDDADEIVTFCRDLGTRFVQLHGDVPVAELERLTGLGPDLVVFKSLVVGRQADEDLEAIVRCAAPHVAAFITDTFDPATGASGATGLVHDWSVSRRLVEVSSRPVILAGGLNPANVREAIRVVRPAGVDVHTGVEDESSRKSRDLVTRFVAEAHAGFAEVRGRSAGPA